MMMDSKIDIVVRAKQTDIDNKIYYTQVRTEPSTTPDKSNKTPILISSKLNIQLFIN